MGVRVKETRRVWTFSAGTRAPLCPSWICSTWSSEMFPPAPKFDICNRDIKFFLNISSWPRRYRAKWEDLSQEAPRPPRGCREGWLCSCRRKCFIADLRPLSPGYWVTNGESIHERMHVRVNKHTGPTSKPGLIPWGNVEREVFGLRPLTLLTWISEVQVGVGGGVVGVSKPSEGYVPASSPLKSPMLILCFCCQTIRVT